MIFIMGNQTLQGLLGRLLWVGIRVYCKGDPEFSWIICAHEAVIGIVAIAGYPTQCVDVITFVTGII